MRARFSGIQHAYFYLTTLLSVVEPHLQCLSQEALCLVSPSPETRSPVLCQDCRVGWRRGGMLTCMLGVGDIFDGCDCFLDFQQILPFYPPPSAPFLETSTAVNLCCKIELVPSFPLCWLLRSIQFSLPLTHCFPASRLFVCLFVCFVLLFCSLCLCWFVLPKNVSYCQFWGLERK